MKLVKKTIKKLFILILLAGTPVSWILFDNILNTTKITATSAMTASNIKHKQEIIRLKAKHKKEIAKLKLNNKKNIAKVKMKERSKRLLASIPIIGTASLLWTSNEEYQDYKHWLMSNPGGTADDYASYKTSLLLDP